MHIVSFISSAVFQSSAFAYQGDEKIGIPEDSYLKIEHACQERELAFCSLAGISLVRKCVKRPINFEERKGELERSGLVEDQQGQRKPRQSP